MSILIITNNFIYHNFYCHKNTFIVTFIKKYLKNLIICHQIFIIYIKMSIFINLIYIKISLCNYIIFHIQSLIIFVCLNIELSITISI